MAVVRRMSGPTPMDHTCLLLNKTTKEHEEFESRAQGFGMKKIVLFRQMMGKERKRRARTTEEG